MGSSPHIDATSKELRKKLSDTRALSVSRFEKSNKERYLPRSNNFSYLQVTRFRSLNGRTFQDAIAVAASCEYCNIGNRARRILAVRHSLVYFFFVAEERRVNGLAPLPFAFVCLVMACFTLLHSLALAQIPESFEKTTLGAWQAIEEMRMLLPQVKGKIIFLSLTKWASASFPCLLNSILLTLTTHIFSFRCVRICTINLRPDPGHG